MTCVCGQPIPTQGRGRPRRYCSDGCRLYAGNRGAWPSRVCSRQRCNKPVDKEGLCSMHLRRMLASQKAWTVRDQLLDWLEVDGGWLTADGLAVDLGRNVQVVERTLRVLRDAGLVESRARVLALTVNGHEESRTEWRLS